MSHVMCHVSGVRCHVSGVTCQVSRVRFHVSGVTCHNFFSFFFFGQSGGTSRWRVCYQRGLPRLVYILLSTKFLFSKLQCNVVKFREAFSLQPMRGSQPTTKCKNVAVMNKYSAFVHVLLLLASIFGIYLPNN